MVWYQALGFHVVIVVSLPCAASFHASFLTSCAKIPITSITEPIAAHLPAVEVIATQG